MHIFFLCHEANLESLSMILGNRIAHLKPPEATTIYFLNALCEMLLSGNHLLLVML